MQSITLTDRAQVDTMVDEALHDTDKFVSLVKILSEIVAEKLPEKKSERLLS